MIAKGIVELPEEEERVDEAKIMDTSELQFDDNIDDLLNDAFRDEPNEDAKKFYKLVEEGQQELFPGCKTFSKLSFTIRLFLYKRDHRLSIAAFVELLKILKDIQPDANLPRSFNEARSTLKPLGLDYIKIDACPNDCMLYWEENANATSCHVCKASRWKSEKVDEITGKFRRISAKVLRYFPIKKRLQTLFMSPETAHHMTWHASERPKDGLLRHPADGDDWKNFDLQYSKFAEDPRNVRLGLSSDGFNPFSTMSIAYSTWPVILTNYNLPPWLCTKSEFLMLALLIPGPSSPGNAIDIYMQPLVKDLKELWEFGIETYDSLRKQVFNMHAALMCTISDFPAYAMLSRWGTKGKMACPNCHYETQSLWLPSSRKYCYMGHCRFKGENKTESAPARLSGTETSDLLNGFPNKFGKLIEKTQKNDDDICPWKKKKNICDSVLGTLLDIPGKTKDHMKAREDLEKLDMMPELQPKRSKDGQRTLIAKSRFWMTPAEKKLFLSVFKNAKLPKGYCSNIARCVQMKERKIAGYKSHDAHFILHYLLPVAVRKTLPKDVAVPLIRLSAFGGAC